MENRATLIGTNGAGRFPAGGCAEETALERTREATQQKPHRCRLGSLLSSQMPEPSARRVNLTA